MPDDAQVDPGRIIEELRRELDARIAERDEALAQQAAISEIVQITNRSGGDLAPVFDAMLEKAVRLCEAAYGTLVRFDGENVQVVALRDVPAAFADLLQAPRRVRPGTAIDQLNRGERFIHVPDVSAEAEYISSDPVRRAYVELGGARSYLVVPLRNEGMLLGAIMAYRQEARAFTDKQIALLESFAAQAVIAMENARLITETREALEQQTATAEVLKAISRSTFDLAAVLQTVVSAAHRLCQSDYSVIFRQEGDEYRWAAGYGISAEYEERERRAVIRPGTGTVIGRAVLTGHAVQIADAKADPLYQGEAEGDARAMLGVPLLRDGVAIGSIGLARNRVEPFTDKQVELVTTFADQAVIAIENARLLTETREALEQQTATAEVLQVINSSPGDLAPVFDAMLDKAMRLCEAAGGALRAYDGAGFRAVAMRGVPAAFAEATREQVRPDPQTGLGRIEHGERVVQIADLADPQDPRAGTRSRRDMVELGGTSLWVALRKEETLLGTFVLYRKEVRPFTEKQIALVENFAAQAVIAMENARLLTETREALEQQTATAEVLQVINASPGDLAPVFDAMLEKAMRLCEAAFGMMHTYDGKNVHPVAMRGIPPRFAEFAADPASQPGPGAVTPRLAAGARFVHVTDLMEEEAYQSGEAYRRALVDLGGARALLAVPLRKDGVMLGQVAIYRTEARPYADKQIALLQNFAAQAVIAMENARLITETREALEQQTATADVLQVINSSPGDLAPVFDAILEKALGLCEAKFGNITTYDGEAFHFAAAAGYPEFAEFLSREAVRPSPVTGWGRIAAGEQFVHIVDLAAEQAYKDREPLRVATVELGGARTCIFVPLVKDNAILGVLTAYRQEVRPFSDKQIALLQNFAAQAVIAMENARLLTETREALEQQTATAEVLQVINSSPGDLAPVFDAILEKAHGLCGIIHGSLQLYDGEKFRPMTLRGYPASLADRLQHGWSPGPSHPMRALIDGERFAHFDLAQVDDPAARTVAELGGVRSALFVALQKDDALLGVITAARQEVRPFSEKQIALLQNFAAQAVIAMENARLITETREALEQQTATAEVLQVINSSPGDLVPVFDAMLEKAMRLCEAAIGSFLSYDGQAFQVLASTVGDIGRIMHPGPNTSLWRLARGESVVQIADVEREAAYRTDAVGQARTRLAGTRTALAVALCKDETLVGAITTGRQEVRPFSDKQIALLQNFAAQAVIAMENARLLTETREALAQQTATAEVLQVINNSPGDLAPVFDAMLEKAMALCGIAHGGLQIYDGQQFRAVSVRGLPEPLAALLRRGYRLSPGHPMQRLLEGDRFVQIADLTQVAPELQNVMRIAVEAGDRTLLYIPLRKDDALLGVIVAVRRQVRPFSEKEIALLENFAAQAVIAMENARLITETREALEQQTATSEVLGVINSSPGDLAPVFDAILEKAHSLCGVSFGSLLLYDGGQFHAGATRGLPEPLTDLLRQPFPPDPDGPLARLLAGERFYQIGDQAEFLTTSLNPRARATFDLAGVRTVLWVPLRRDEALLGAIVAYRREPQVFSEKQITLLQNFAAQAVIAMENARLLTETREALEQQTATSEVLGVINSSPGDLAPVFDAMLDKAMRLCGAAFGELHTYDGERFHTAALRGVPTAYAAVRENSSLPTRPGTGGAKLLQQRRPVHTLDLMAEDIYRDGDPGRRAIVDLGGARTSLTVPLLKDEVVLGGIVIYRQEVRPFSDKQIALLQNFAAQAVIAIENARLLTETREALEQQTATAEVLQVINSSPGDLAPVFDAMLEKAIRLCESSFGALRRFDGKMFWAIAVRDASGAAAEIAHEPVVPDPGSASERIVQGESVVHIPDLFDTEEYRSGVVSRLIVVEKLGARTALWVALRKDDVLMGDFVIYRKEVRPFTDKQIALLQNFAAQAVIAMENARLITETREALEQQTATAEVLQVINSSPGDLAPVFDAMLERAMRLCDAAFGVMQGYDGERFYPRALRGVPPAYAEFLMREPLKFSPDTALGRIEAGEEFVHFVDVAVDGPQGSSMLQTLQQLGGIRSVLFAALRKDGVLLGAVVIYRQDARPFSEKEIALLENFAAQAVIAMENARLLGELRRRTSDLEESLEFQTATSDVLQVISRSTFDLRPVLDTLCETAARLCSADTAHIVNRDGETYRTAATFGYSPDFDEFVRTLSFAPDRGTVVGRVLLDAQVVHLEDAAADPEYAVPGAVHRGARTQLGVPLLREGEPIGVIILVRLRVEPFTERQIELVRTFADQAVIAIENTRLITETREALEQQTATAELLGVINSSPGDLAPVFEAMLEKAIRLCGGIQGALWTIDGGHAKAAASHGNTPEFVAMLRERERAGMGPPEAVQLTMGEERLLHIPDLVEHELYRTGEPITRAAVELSGVRSLVGVALVKDGAPIGAFMIGRREVRPYSDKQIALLQNFAAQAVIAMDNARLLDEIRQRQAELRVTFDNMGDGVAMFDSALRLAAWNLNFQRILEIPDPLLAERPRVGDFVRYLASHGEFGAVDVEAEVHRLSERVGTPWSNERTRPDGRVIEVRSNPVPGGGVVLIYSDVTERKRAEAEIRAARDTAERALQELQAAQASLLHAQKMAALGQLTAGIAHEIKNPLNFINNFAELSGELLLELKETTAPAVATLGDDERAAVDEVVEMLRGNLDKIAEHGKRADGIVKSMLEHSRGVSGERRAVDLNALIEEALNLAYHGARAQDASFNITLEREFDRGLAPTELAPQEMTRVFLNLFGNGFYATAKRQRDGAETKFRPTLKVATRDLGDTVEVRVRDNGTGIAPEIRDKLFQPFVTTKPTGEGTGLGLSISYDIVTQQHGGTIEVDSRQGEFTEFTIRLPRAH